MSNLFTKIESPKFGFSLSVVSASPEPQKNIYMALHQCYSDEAVTASNLAEDKSGQIAIDRLLKGNRGHFSPTEFANITFQIQTNHGTVQQILRSRIGVSYAVQSFRYTCSQIHRAASKGADVEKLVYLRPTGTYKYDSKTEYNYTAKDRAEDLSVAAFNVAHVSKRLNEGMPPEQARGQLPFDYRQNMMISGNLRYLMGFFDRRTKKDAQIEIQVISDMMIEKFKIWCPEIADWYLNNRYGKAMLAP